MHVSQADELDNKHLSNITLESADIGMQKKAILCFLFNEGPISQTIAFQRRVK